MGDADKVIRRVTRKFPEELAKAVYGAHVKLEVGEWLETQLVGPERRLDRTLRLSMDGSPRLLHFEFQSILEPDVPFRVFEYHALLAISFFDPEHPKERPRIDSCVVVLGGPIEELPKESTYQTSCPERPFSGVQFRIEAVYQKTVQELLESGSLLWLIFAPLAKDASEENLKSVVDYVKKTATHDYLYEELAIAMAVLADSDSKKRNFRPYITSMIPKEVIMQSWIYHEGQNAGLIRAKIEDVLEIIKVRKLRITKQQKAQIESCSDIALLTLWHTKAITASSVSDMLAPPTPVKPKKPAAASKKSV